MRGRRLQLTLEELKYKVNEYFNKCDENQEPYTMTGLARNLKVSRQTLWNYEHEVRTFIDMNDNEVSEFIDIVKDARMRVEEYNEKQLHNGKNSAGSIFVLKNMGWKDTQEITSTNNNINVNNNLLQQMDKRELLQLVEQLSNKTGKE